MHRQWTICLEIQYKRDKLEMVVVDQSGVAIQYMKNKMEKKWKTKKGKEKEREKRKRYTRLVCKLSGH